MSCVWYRCVCTIARRECSVCGSHGRERRKKIRLLWRLHWLRLTVSVSGARQIWFDANAFCAHSWSQNRVILVLLRDGVTSINYYSFPFMFVKVTLNNRESHIAISYSQHQLFLQVPVLSPPAEFPKNNVLSFSYFKSMHMFRYYP